MLKRLVVWKLWQMFRTFQLLHHLHIGASKKRAHLSYYLYLRTISLHRTEKHGQHVVLDVSLGCLAQQQVHVLEEE